MANVAASVSEWWFVHALGPFKIASQLLVAFALLGSALGLAGAFVLGRLLQAILPALPPAELLTAALVTAALLSVALLACYLPARRATKVDPMIALRSEKFEVRKPKSELQFPRPLMPSAKLRTSAFEPRTSPAS